VTSPVRTRSGILAVDKDPGPTSFDVVALVRRRLGVRRVGHAGTLDPGAEGVLPILIGEATKLMPYLSAQDKEYRVTVRLGVRTDTQDLTGRILQETPAAGVTRQGLESAAERFVGRIRQVPPMYSALHREGRRLYELAREGREVDREPRDVTIHAIAVESFDLPRAVLRVVCGKGTYIRALAADLGDALGPGAAVETLVRLQVGPFRRDDAVPRRHLDERPAEELWARVQPPEAALAAWPVVRLDAQGTRMFLHGQPAAVAPGAAAAGTQVVVRGDGGGFLGVGEMTGPVAVRPARIVHADRPGPHVLRA
jgi:tRNA pseudouridine55 synthase